MKTQAVQLCMFGAPTLPFADVLPADPPPPQFRPAWAFRKEVFREDAAELVAKVKAAVPDFNEWIASPEGQAALAVKRAEQERSSVCRACDGTGRSSRGRRCVPCDGTGVRI